MSALIILEETGEKGKGIRSTPSFRCMPGHADARRSNADAFTTTAARVDQDFLSIIEGNSIIMGMLSG
jgi:hypothetical protein